MVCIRPIVYGWLWSQYWIPSNLFRWPLSRELQLFQGINLKGLKETYVSFKIRQLLFLWNACIVFVNSSAAEEEEAAEKQESLEMSQVWLGDDEDDEDEDEETDEDGEEPREKQELNSSLWVFHTQ